MPPQNPLDPDLVTAIKQWIEAGAPYANEPLIASVKRAGPDWWSLQKIKRPSPPVVSNPTWTRTPIDAFILAKLDERGLSLRTRD